MSVDAKPRILVIEDEPDLVELVRINLELSGHEVLSAADGAEGLTAARHERPDLILLDVMMPVLDGWQVLLALKEDAELEDIPVVMLTALSEERDLIRGHLQGAIRYVTKPFEMRELLRVIEEGLAPLSDEERAERRRRTRLLLQRLAELDSGRAAPEQTVHLSRLETPRRAETAAPRATPGDRTRLEQLTGKQRYIAEQLAAGRSARELAEELDVSRSNIYATRKRIARKLGINPETVAEEGRRLGLGTEA